MWLLSWWLGLAVKLRWFEFDTRLKLRKRPARIYRSDRFLKKD
jgi:hypothetical protein